VTTTVAIGRAMIQVAAAGYTKRILLSADIQVTTTVAIGRAMIPSWLPHDDRRPPPAGSQAAREPFVTPIADPGLHAHAERSHGALRHARRIRKLQRRCAGAQ